MEEWERKEERKGEGRERGKAEKRGRDEKGDKGGGEVLEMNKMKNLDLISGLKIIMSLWVLLNNLRVSSFI